MQKVVYLPRANRVCSDCGCTKAVAAHVRHRLTCSDPLMALAEVRPCGRCGDEIEVAPSPGARATPAYDFFCEDCGAGENLTRAEIQLPDGLGVGYVRLCADCVARYDEEGAAWAR